MSNINKKKIIKKVIKKSLLPRSSAKIASIPPKNKVTRSKKLKLFTLTNKNKKSYLYRNLLKCNKNYLMIGNRN